MLRFRSELEQIEGLTMDQLAGRRFMGVTLDGPGHLLRMVRELAPHYKVWRSFCHYLDSRAEVRDAAG
jgi:hypothetical protein